MKKKNLLSAAGKRETTAKGGGRESNKRVPMTKGKGLGNIIFVNSEGSVTMTSTSDYLEKKTVTAGKRGEKRGSIFVVHCGMWPSFRNAFRFQEKRRD